MQAAPIHGAPRITAFMQQRVCFDGTYMVRAEALRLHSQAHKWRDMGKVLSLPHEPIEDDVPWSPPSPDDLDQLIEDNMLAERFIVRSYAQLL